MKLIKGRYRPDTKTLSLQTRVILLSVLSMVMVLAAFGLVGTNALRASTERTLAERLLLAQQTASYLDFALGQTLAQLEQIAGDKPLDLKGDVNKTARPMLRAIQQRLLIPPSYVSLVNSQGIILLNEPANQSLVGAPVPNLEQARDTFMTGKPRIASKTDVTDKQSPLIYLTSPVWDDNERVSGLIQAAIDLSRSSLNAFIQPLGLGQTGYAEIVDSNGLVVASTKAENLFQRGDHGDQFAILINQDKTTSGTCHGCHSGAGGEQRQKEVLAFAPLSNTGWGIALRQSEGEALAATRELQQRLLILGAATLLIVLLAVWLFARSAVSPLRQLNVASRKIAEGNLAEAVPMGGSGEIATLADTLETMRQRLHVSQEKLQQWNRELEERVEQRTKELTAVIEASQTLVSTLDTESLVTAMVRAAVDTFRADAGALFLYDPQEERLLPKSAIGYNFEPMSKVKLKPGEAIAGKAFQTGKPILCITPEEVKQALPPVTVENLAYLLRARENREVQSCLCVPLRSRELTLGSLILVNLREQATFTSHDLQLVSVFAIHAAVLLENARLLKEASRVEALNQANQLKTEFISNISHELQTPLSSLRASLDFLLTAIPDSAEEAQVGLLRNISRSANRLSRLVKDLIDVTQLQSRGLTLSLEPLDLRDVLDAVADSFKLLAEGKGQTLELTLPPTPTLINGDWHRLEQIVNNLLDNAIRYTPEHGRIRITVNDKVDQIIVTVADTGPGIAREEQEPIFERFYRGHQGTGTGLGLPIAKGLVELHGGRIWVESEPGKGSVFSFSLAKAVNYENSYS